ncbi:Hypothetical_protein [Hexamita inflata]|uniref:Hypothetical_protein n=1 Tax=Hexamita inflata TaxID=28002 RepID=A0AA86QG94_9EUKA|nr:Hypothetical protein HINF_LOCUS40239 [Hexamita inflata]
MQSIIEWMFLRCTKRVSRYINKSEINFVFFYQVILDCYQIYNSDTAKNSGFLLGYVTNQGNIYGILIQNLCLMQRVQITKRFEAFGFIGWQDNANISVQQGNYFSCWARGSVQLVIQVLGALIPNLQTLSQQF